jgi:protein required for attachment to host cells
MMTNDQWIVVGNGSRAAFYSRDPDDESGALNLEASFEHPDSRRKGADLVSDRPGAVRGHGSDSTRYVQRVGPKRNELEHFGQQLADELNRLHGAGRIARLTLVVSNPMLGILAARLPQAVRDTVDAQIAHDYTTLPERELRQRLAEHLTVSP